MRWNLYVNEKRPVLLIKPLVKLATVDHKRKFLLLRRKFLVFKNNVGILISFLSGKKLIYIFKIREIMKREEKNKTL